MSSDSEHEVKRDHKKSKSSKPAKAGIEYQIMPEKGDSSVDTSSWPLLLKVIIFPPQCRPE